MQKLSQDNNNFLFLLQKIRSIACFLFHLNIRQSELFFPDSIGIEISKKTQRIRYVFIDGKLICSIRPNDGLILLTIFGGEILKNIIKPPRMRVIVKNEVAEFISQGRNVFAKHVVDADNEIRPYSEVLIVNESDDLLAIGKAILNREEMLAFQKGVAVKVRHGSKK
ncbi:MAG: PUA domain-containing protein [Candidatus Hodarchaeota archaeon]